MTQTREPEPVVEAGLAVEHLSKVYETAHHRVPVLDDVSFALEAGEAAAVTGPSGCGKSTLLHIIGTLDQPTSGTVRIGGTNPHTLPEAELAAFRNEHVGFVFQDHHLLPQFTVLQNVSLPSLPAGATGARERALQLLDQVGLADRTSHRPAELSGGERQRVAIARALINQPDLLLCDEPTGNLDPKTAEVVAQLLFDLQAQEKRTMIVVTHSLELAQRFPRRLALSVDGVVEEG